jgi:hypothetical protein
MKKAEALQELIPLKQWLYHTKQCCLAKFGLFADAKATLQHNFNQAISTLSNPNYHQPTNLSFHNLCKKTTIPVGTKQLLGLNLKFCLSSRTLNNNINDTV